MILFQPRSGVRVFRRSAAYGLRDDNHGLQPWLHSDSAPRLNPRSFRFPRYVCFPEPDQEFWVYYCFESTRRLSLRSLESRNTLRILNISVTSQFQGCIKLAHFRGGNEPIS